MEHAMSEENHQIWGTDVGDLRSSHM